MKQETKANVTKEIIKLFHAYDIIQTHETIQIYPNQYNGTAVSFSDYQLNKLNHILDVQDEVVIYYICLKNNKFYLEVL